MHKKVEFLLNELLNCANQYTDVLNIDSICQVFDSAKFTIRLFGIVPSNKIPKKIEFLGDMDKLNINTQSSISE